MKKGPPAEEGRDADLEVDPAILKHKAGMQLRESATGTTNPHHHCRPWEGSVPHSESGVVPMSSLLGVGQLGFWEVGMGEQLGEGWGKWGQSTSNLRRGRTVPVTAGGRQVSEGEHKGEQKGQQGEQGELGKR